MKNYIIAERYAKGLSQSMPDDTLLEAAMDALNRLSELYTANHDLRSALANPSIDVDMRYAVLQDVADAEETPPAVQRLAALLLRRGRIAMLPDVAAVFSALVDERLERVRAQVTTAVELGGEQEAQLAQALARFSGKSVRLACGVDPDVLGGVVARMGSTVIDGSVRTRLERLRHALLSEET